MIKVYVTKQSNYPVGATQIKSNLRKFLEEQGIVSDAVVYVNLVGEKAMKVLSHKYLGEENQLHNVLSFPESEIKGKFVYPEGSIRLGEIVLCYPVVVDEAKKDDMLIDDKMKDLIEHGALHLLGQHHD
jgi:probable rRNA maturation factor